MESSSMKNMVVLKNLPSNMVDEAIIIFKENSRIKTKDAINKTNKMNQMKEKGKSKEIIYKEAEMLVNDYIRKIESKDSKNIFERKIKNNFWKQYSIIVTIFFAISLVINFI